jgi:hypothetical protein
MSTDELPQEDDLASLLAACDEALAAGNLATTLRPGPGANGEPPRLQRDLACVHCCDCGRAKERSRAAVCARRPRRCDRPVCARS